MESSHIQTFDFTRSRAYEALQVVLQHWMCPPVINDNPVLVEEKLSLLKRNVLALLNPQVVENNPALNNSLVNLELPFTLFDYAFAESLMTELEDRFTFDDFLPFPANQNDDVSDYTIYALTVYGLLTNANCSIVIKRFGSALFDSRRTTLHQSVLSSLLEFHSCHAPISSTFLIQSTV